MDTRSEIYRQEVMTVTPEIAGEMLGKNSNNRRPREHVVRQYSQMMREGRWDESSPASIAFYKDGTLADGQHRLMGVKRAGVPVKMLVVFGCDRTPYIDTGLRRTGADNLRIADPRLSWVNGRHMACANLLITEFPQIGCGQDNGKKGEYLLRYQSSFEWVSKNYTGREAGLKQAGVNAAFVCAHMAGADVEILTRAAYYLATGKAYDDDKYVDAMHNPVIDLRNTLLKGAIGKGRQAGKRLQHDALYCTANTLKFCMNGAKGKGKVEIPLVFPLPVYGLDGGIIYTPKKS